MNILVINLGLLLIAATQTYEHWDKVKPLLSTIKQCIVTWPILHTISILALTVIGSAWVVEVLL